MRTLLLLAMALLGTSATAAPVPKELKKQQGSIVGFWKLESAVIFGTACVDADETDWTFDENSTLTRSNSQNGPQTRLVQLRIDTMTKEIDWPKLTFLGRYEVSGDRLTICVGTGNLRPTTLEPNEDNYLWVLRRAEK